MVVGDSESTATKNVGESMADAAVQRGKPARESISRASFKATGCLHRASACAVLPGQPPWSKNLNKTHKTLT